MPCNKRPFNSPEEARGQLRVWQQRARRSALDTVHVYKCREEEHRGKFHVGHSPDRIKRSRGMRSMNKRRDYEETRSRVFGSLDDLFFEQEVRVRGALNRYTRDKGQRVDAGSPFIQAETSNLAYSGDDYDVEDK